MRLRVSGDLPLPVVEQLQEDLSPLLPIVLFRTTELREGYLPSQVRLIGELSEWVDSLKGPAAALLSSVSSRGSLGSSPSQARDGVAPPGTNVEPLKQLARILSSVLKMKIQKHLQVSVGLAVPDWQHGTTLTLKDPDDESIALAIARFVNQLGDVEVAIREEMKSPRKPYGQVHLEVGAKGPMILRWLDEKTLNFHERELGPPSGTADVK
jgi:hypothetical protein